MKKTTLYTLCLLLLSLVTHAQVTGDYRSSATPVDLNVVANWETFDGTAWNAATLVPNGNVASGNTITILAAHAWNNTLDAAIPTGVTLVFQSTVAGTFTTGKTITINGILENQSTTAIPVTAGSTTIINGTYKHNVTTGPGTILKTSGTGIVTYSDNSTLEVIGYTTSTTASSLPTSAYHVIWNCTNQTTALSIVSATSTIRGNFTVKSTGTGSIYMGNSTTARTINVTGNLNVEGGDLKLVGVTSVTTTLANQTMTVNGNIAISGGKFSLSGAVTSFVSASVGNGILNLKGNLTHSAGTFGNVSGTTVRQSTITFNGTGAQAFTTTGLNGDSVHVTLNGATTTVVTLNSDLTLSKGVFTNTLGSLVISAGKYLTLGSTGSNNMCGSNTANTITLKSDASGTAGLGTISGSVTNTSRIMVERYIPSAGRRKYVMVTSPVQSTLNDWQEGATGASFVPGTAGYGTQITKVVSQGTDGYDGPATSNASIFTYNDDNLTGSKWVAYAGASGTNTALSLTGGVGYLLFVRGDRSEDRASLGTSSNTTLRARGAGLGATAGSGTIIRGNVTSGANNFPPLNANTEKYTLIGNPYPCTIDWLSSGITKTGLTGSFTVYDPNLGVFVSSNGTTVTPQSGIGTSKQQAQYIQSGQAFFVQNDATSTHTIAFAESAKVTSATTSATTTVFGGSAAALAQLNINTYRTAGNIFADGAVAIFSANNKAVIDASEDIIKFSNFNETFGLRRNNKVLGLEARPLVASTDTLYLNMSNFGKRDYSLVIDGSNFSNTTATLEDQYKATKTIIDLNGTTTYNFTVDANAASLSNDRFKIIFGSTAPSVVIADAPAAGLFVKMSPNPVTNQLMVSFRNAVADETTINVVNSLGQVVKTVKAGNVATGNITVPVSDLAVGVYSVQLLSGGKQVSTQKIVKQ